jgi:hypothetical protein
MKSLAIPAACMIIAGGAQQSVQSYVIYGERSIGKVAHPFGLDSFCRALHDAQPSLHPAASLTISLSTTTSRR